MLYFCFGFCLSCYKGLLFTLDYYTLTLIFSFSMNMIPLSMTDHACIIVSPFLHTDDALLGSHCDWKRCFHPELEGVQDQIHYHEISLFDALTTSLTFICHWLSVVDFAVQVL